MIAAINDLSFQYQMSSCDEAVERIKTFISLCKDVESGRMTNVEKIVIGPDCDYSGQIAPGLVLQQIILHIQPKDAQRYLMSLLRNSDTVSICESEVPFWMDGKSSKLCSYVKNDILISLCSSPIFESELIEGTSGDIICTIANLALERHVDSHQEKLGIRHYHANIGKHKPNRENKYGKGKVASPMDLSDADAQELLNKAIPVDSRLYAKKGGKIYTFMKESPCTYHGYINYEVRECKIKCVS